MQFFFSLYPDSKALYLRSERIQSADGSVSGALRYLLKPGESCGRYTYDELARLGDGWHELDVNALDEAGRAAV